MRFQNDFGQHFVPLYQRGQGRKDYTVLSGLAAEFLIDLLGDIWNNADVAVALPKGRKKFQVLIFCNNIG